jgi:lysine decarboxylase
VDLKADLVIQSTHKTLTALTQASMLHHNGSRIDLNRLEQILATLQSSSPSALLLASLDHARMVAAVHGESLLARALELAHTARQALRALDGVWCLGEESVGTAGVAAYDPTKLVIRVSRTGLTGYEVSQRLLDQHHIVTEFADTHQIICSITTADTPADVERLIGAVRTILAGPARRALEVDAPIPIPDLPPQILTPRAAFLARSLAISLVDAVGEIAADYLIPYPPGIPLLVPGERITPEMLDYCRTLAARGASFGEGGGLVQQQIRIVIKE